MAKYDKNGYITELEKDEVFVFGSNGHGAHLGGAAATAVHKFGAKMGQAEGLQGQSYAINTMDGYEEMVAQIKRFLKFAKEHPELTFLVTEIGCGIAGYSPKQMAPHFKNHTDNVVLPKTFETKKLNEKVDKNTSKARGMLMGLAIGDALGAPVQFGNSSDAIRMNLDYVSHMHDNHVLPKGVWTDDTSMALCIADSLLECGGYDSYDIMNKYLDWEAYGYRSYFDFGYDEGGQTANSLSNYRHDPIVPKDAEKEWNAGNGAIMRLAPIVIAGKHDTKAGSPEERDHIIELARLSCRETHDSYMAIAVTEAFATLLALCYSYKDTASAIEHCTCWLSRNNEEERNCENEIHDAISRAIQSKDGEEFRDLGGYILDAFAIAVWGLLHFKSFKEGMIAVIGLGGDTDTNGAIYGQLAGAYYGFESIPKEWRDDVYLSEEIIDIADRLSSMNECPILRTRFEDNEFFENITDKKKTAKKSDNPKSIKEILKKMRGKQ